MKKLTALALCALLLLTTGCAYAARQASESETYYNLYFTLADLASADGGDAVATQASALRRDDGRDLTVQARALMGQLLRGPSEERLKSPFPSNTQLLSLMVDGTRAKVDLSSAYGTLSGVALTLADYCITLTLTQLAGVTSVAVTVRGQELAYRDSQIFSGDDVLFSSTEDVVGTVGVTLFFPNADGLLTGESRTLDLYEGDTQAEALLSALQDGPRSKDLKPALPEGFTVQSVWTENDICYVNLSPAVLQKLPQDADIALTLQAIARSLHTLDAVGEVQYLLDGEKAAAYGGVNISRPF